MGVHHLNSRGNNTVRESITPTQGATMKLGSPSPQLEGGHQRLGVHDPTQGATRKRGSPSPQPKGPHRSVGVQHPKSRGHNETWESITPHSMCSTMVGGGWRLAVGGGRRLAVGNWPLVAVDGGWRRLVVGDWRLVVVGNGWQLAVGRRWRSAAVGGGWRLMGVGGWRSFRAVLSKKNKNLVP